MASQAKDKSPSGRSALRQFYDRSLSNLEALREEAHFILERAVAKAGIKTHLIESRVKDFESFYTKMQSGNYNNKEKINDLVGVRVICLFKSDIQKILDIISESFDIITVDDKVDANSDTFGYMSVHCISIMKKEYAGPRYDAIRGNVFEIQIRTLCMHAWAAISHYLDYKSEWDIPDHLRKGLNALSGLFYVADAQYEQLYNSRQDARRSAENASGKSIEDQQINLTLFKLFSKGYFQRDQSMDPAAYPI